MTEQSFESKILDHLQRYNYNNEYNENILQLTCLLLKDDIEGMTIEEIISRLVLTNDVNAQDSLGFTALMISCYVKRDNIRHKKVDALLKAGADPNIQDSRGRTALTYLCRRSIDAKTTELLLQAGADPNISYDRECPLSDAKTRKISKLLLQYGADPNLLPGIYINNPLRKASSRKDYKLVKLLLQAGATPNFQDNDICMAITPILHEEILFLKNKIAELEYAPGNVGYQQAMNHYESLCKM